MRELTIQNDCINVLCELNLFPWRDEPEHGVWMQVDYLLKHEQWNEAATLLAQALNRDSFQSKKV